MKNIRQPKTRQYIRASLLALVILMSIVLPMGAQAGERRDPIFGAKVSDEPEWLRMHETTPRLYSEYKLAGLAGQMLNYNLIRADDCPGRGLLSTSVANKCGIQRTLSVIYEWQNRFNPAIITASRNTGVPPILLKNIFAWESQFWPRTVYVNTYEYGLGHMTEMGADSLLRWNVPFYDAACAITFQADTCEEAYSDQPLPIQATLRGVVVQRVNADCANCTYGLDLALAERSIPIFAHTLVANASLVKLYIKSATGRPASDVVSYEDLWKFTLTSYNAGPGCFVNALTRSLNISKKLDWKTFSAQLDPGCQGSIPYVEFISRADQYHPEHDPAIIPTPTRIAASPTASPTSTKPVETATPSPIVTEEITVTPTDDVTPTEEITPSPTDEITPTDEVTPSPTEEITPVPTDEVTPTPTSEIMPPSTEEVTPPPTDEVTPTPTAGITPSPTEEITPTPTDDVMPPTTEEVTPTPTEESTPTSEVTPTPTEAGTPTPSATPAATATSTATPSPVPTATPRDGNPPVGEQLRSPHADNQVVLKIDPQYREQALETLTNMGFNLNHTGVNLGSLNSLILNLAPGELGDVLGNLRSTGYFEYVEPNYLAQISGLPNDPDLARQSALWPMQIPQTWDAITSMQEVVVAVLDTGVSASHPDLADRVWINAGEYGLDANGVDRATNGLDDDQNGYVDDWRGWNMISASNDPADDQGHGTHSAGIIGAGFNNSVGIAGIAPNARILPVKVLDKSGQGTYAQVAEGIVYATDMGARIINLGFGGLGSSDLLQNAVNYAVEHGVLVVAAAGNGGMNTTYYPAAYPGVIAVGAVDDTMTWAPFSSSGSHISLVAPGVGIYSTVTNGGYAILSGTSMSAAQVSGVAALLAGQARFADVNLLRSALLNKALDLGETGRDSYYGYGLVRAYDALGYAGQILPTPTPWSAPTSTPGGTGVVSSMAVQYLWGLTQSAWQTIYDPGNITPALNSVDSAFNDLSSYSTGAYGSTAARTWTFLTFGPPTTYLTGTLAKVTLDLRFYMANWANDTYYIQVYEPGYPGNIGGWNTVYTLSFIGNKPPSTLTTVSIPVTQWLNTGAKVNATQVRITGSGLTGGVADVVTIYIDEARLEVMDVLPPTATPTSTAVFIPTATLPARAATASPIAGEPHNHFVSMTTDECAKCHRDHTSKTTSLRSDTGEEQVCFACHSTGGLGTNVQPAFTLKSNTLTRFFSHPVSSTVNVHHAGENVGGFFGGANRHVECEDCHSPHSPARTDLSLGSILAPSAQQEVFDTTGVDPTWTVAGSPTGFTFMTTAEREYQVCLKCHSSFAPLPSYAPDGYGWDTGSVAAGYIANGLPKLTSTNPAQVLDSRDLAKEFNSYQVSFHPVAAQGRNRSIPAGSFVAPWNIDSIVYCTDCHDNSTAPANGSGPHGSNLLHLLDNSGNGSAEYITHTDPAQSCAPGGCPSIQNPGELCFKCHQYGTYASGANPITTTRFKNATSNLHVFHSFAACYACHDSHGSEQDRLINFDLSIVTVGAGYTSQSAWQFNSVTGVGTCYVSCHDGDHGATSDRQYMP